MFSSPSKQATSAAQAEGAISQQDITALENYVSGQQGQLRSAIGGLGENPYLGASPLVTPSQYQTNPSDTVTFGQGNLPPGLSQGTPTPQAPAPPSAPSAPAPPSTGSAPRTTTQGGEPRSTNFPTPPAATTPTTPPKTTAPVGTPVQPVVNPPQTTTPGTNPFAPTMPTPPNLTTGNPFVPPTNRRTGVGGQVPL